MKTLSGLALALRASVASPAMALDVTGTWQLDAQFADGWFSHPVCNFQQSGSKIAGSCSGPSYLGPVVGAVSGTSVQLEWDATTTAAPGPGTEARVRAMLSGMQSPDGVIRGTGKDNNNATGSFTLTKK
jgi:hypothetical protein